MNRTEAINEPKSMFPGQTVSVDHVSWSFDSVRDSEQFSAHVHGGMFSRESNNCHLEQGDSWQAVVDAFRKIVAETTPEALAEAAKKRRDAAIRAAEDEYRKAVADFPRPLGVLDAIQSIADAPRDWRKANESVGITDPEVLDKVAAGVARDIAAKE